MKIRPVIGALALGLAISVAGCSAHPGMAARVGDEEISERDIAEVVESYHEVFGVEANPKAVLQVLIAEPVISEVAASRGLTLSDGELDKVIGDIQDQQRAQGLTPVPLSEVAHPDGVRKVLRAAQLLSPNYLVTTAPDEFTEAGFNAYMQEFSNKLVAVDPLVNPRYGTFSMPDIIGPAEYPWITSLAQDPGQVAPAPSGHAEAE